MHKMAFDIEKDADNLDKVHEVVRTIRTRLQKLEQQSKTIEEDDRAGAVRIAQLACGYAALQRVIAYTAYQTNASR